MNNIDFDILNHIIIPNLDIKDIVSLSCVNKRMNDIVYKKNIKKIYNLKIDHDKLHDYFNIFTEISLQINKNDDIKKLCIPENMHKFIVSIDISDNVNIEDISILTKCKNLRTLNINNCNKITDVNFLENIVDLSINNTSITNIKNMNKLVKLTACFCKKLTHIENLVELIDCNLFESNIINIVNCKKIDKINISKCNSFNNFIEIKDVSKLICHGNTQISDLSIFKFLKELNIVCCGGIRTIPYMEFLYKLDMSNTIVNSIDSKIPLIELKMIGCQNIENISDFTNLIKIDISGTKISDITSLKNIRSIIAFRNELNKDSIKFINNNNKIKIYK